MNHKVGDIVKSLYTGHGIRKDYLYEITFIDSKLLCTRSQKCFAECNKFKKNTRTFNVSTEHPITASHYCPGGLCEEDFVKATDREIFMYHLHGTKALIEE